MKKIKVENTEFFIATHSESMLTEFPLKVNNLEQLKLLKIYRGNDVRLVLFQSFFKKDYGNLYWLFWVNSDVPDEIDEKVANLTFAESDFTKSAKTFYQITECSKCKKRFHTLIIPPGDPYPGNSDLLAKKIGLFKFLRCPECNSELRQMVVKIIGEYKQPD